MRLEIDNDRLVFDRRAKVKQESVGDMAIHALAIGAFAFAYMALWGHGLPTKLRGPIGRRLR